MGWLTYDNAFNVNRVQNFNSDTTYKIPIETGTGHYKTAFARFTKEDGWEYLHLDYDRWFPIPDEVEIFDAQDFYY